MIAQSTKAPGEVRACIDQLDLSPIKAKLMDRKGEGWSRELADRAEQEYKRFLFLSVTATVPIVPTKQVDTFWHNHILDTRKYAEDCDRAFGFFLHHFPYLGMRGEEDERQLAESYAGTVEVYEREFGESYGALVEDAQAKAALAADATDTQASDCIGNCVACFSQGTNAEHSDGPLGLNVRPSLANI